jgi:hypothetical protein
MGDGFRAVGASGGTAVGANGGTTVGANGGIAVGANGGTAVGASGGIAVGVSRGIVIAAGAGGGAEEAVFLALSGQPCHEHSSSSASLAEELDPEDQIGQLAVAQRAA